MDKKLTFTISVNGTSTEVTANENAPIRTVVNEALHESGNLGRPIEDWVLKDREGNPIDLDQKVKDLSLTSTSVLFLSLTAGGGGND